MFEGSGHLLSREGHSVQTRQLAGSTTGWQNLSRFHCGQRRAFGLTERTLPTRLQSRRRVPRGVRRERLPLPVTQAHILGAMIVVGETVNTLPMV